MATYSPITQQVRGALTRDTRINLQRSNLSLTEDDGFVTLGGTVPSVAAKRLAVRLARSVPGVKEVRDQLRVAVADSMGDRQIATHVRHALIQERNIEEQQIEIATDPQGGVTLRGTVHSLVQRRLCEVLCWWVPGVTAVDNQIAVDPPDQDNDDELRDNLLVILGKDVLVNPSKFRVDVHDGRVVLQGRVDSSLEKDAAEKDCWYTPGVEDVENRLVID
ncbi:MAG: BON domain-containing protein [Desulfuromonadales bacterium]|nr:BON domain-containing protein [Desulfuromonadales bacterium]